MLRDKTYRPVHVGTAVSGMYRLALFSQVSTVCENLYPELK
jgi:hypothetical protein